MATRELHDLILAFRFDLAEERCRTHPHDVEFRCPRGYTPLHRLVCHRGVACVALAATPPSQSENAFSRREDPILRTARAMLLAADVIGFEGMESSPGRELMGAASLAKDRGNRAMWSPLHLLCQLGAGYEEEGSEDLVRCLLLLDNHHGESGFGGGEDRNGSGEEPNRNHEFGEVTSRRRRFWRARCIASLRDRQGRTPLHLLCERRVPKDDGIVDALLSVDPSLVLSRDRRGHTPLSHLVRCGDDGGAAYHVLRRFVSEAEGVLRPVAPIESNQSEEVTNLEKGESDRKRNSIPSVGHHAPYSRRNLVHSVVRIPATCCPPSLIIRVISNEDSRFVREYDEDGCLPLHVLASNSDKRSAAKIVLDPQQEASMRTTNRSNSETPGTCDQHVYLTDSSRQTTTPSRAAVERSNAFAALLQAYPESASLRNQVGMLPLELASASGTSWDDGIARLVRSHPQALAAIDMDLTSYPQILSLVGNKPTWSGFPMGGERVGLDLMFELVKAKPNLVDCWSVKKNRPANDARGVSAIFKSFRERHKRRGLGKSL
uniref:Uncharacterized protein n=1 Tax=Odontella aurita TaxID=265563 RepID=A0A7S4JEW4_9STRA